MTTIIIVTIVVSVIMAVLSTMVDVLARTLTIDGAVEDLRIVRISVCANAMQELANEVREDRHKAHAAAVVREEMEAYMAAQKEASDKRAMEAMDKYASPEKKAVKAIRARKEAYANKVVADVIAAWRAAKKQQMQVLLEETRVIVKRAA